MPFVQPMLPIVPTPRAPGGEAWRGEAQYAKMPIYRRLRLGYRSLLACRGQRCSRVGGRGRVRFVEGIPMKNVMKGVTIVSIAALGLSLSGCGSESASASAAATPDAADVTAASIDAAPAAPAEQAPPAAAEKAPK
jgi:hypothetical protein